MLSQAEARFINKLPKSINNTLNEKMLKTRLKSLLVSASRYSLDEFMLSHWGNLNREIAIALQHYCCM